MQLTYHLLLGSLAGVGLGASTASKACLFPTQYHIVAFTGRIESGEPGPSMLNFGYVETTTATSTRCRLNASSVSTTARGLTPCFRCDDGAVSFIWQAAKGSLWMMQRVCADNGALSFEASGSVVMPYSCSKGSCVATQVEVPSNFTSLHPVKDPPPA